jgi:AbrB family looped-hinge helix DNA binding protein
MTYTATITSKRQITLPAALFSDMGLKKGQKLTITKRGDELVMKPALSALYKLMGSVKRPEKYKDMDIDEMIELAKMKRFSKGSK